MSCFGGCPNEFGVFRVGSRERVKRDKVINFSTVFGGTGATKIRCLITRVRGCDVPMRRDMRIDLSCLLGTPFMRGSCAG